MEKLNSKSQEISDSEPKEEEYEINQENEMEISTFLKRNLNRRTSLGQKIQDIPQNNNIIENSTMILDRKKNLNQTDLQVKTI